VSTRSLHGEVDHALTHDELAAHILQRTHGHSRNVGLPLASPLWPTGQLTAHQTSLIAAAIRRRKTRRTQRSSP
jgi:hypothetical protein